MDTSSSPHKDDALPEDCRDGIIVVAKSPSLQDGYTITSLTSSRFESSPIYETPLYSPARKSYFLPQLPPHLSLPPEDIHLIISTQSGAEKADATFENVLKPVLCSVGLHEDRYQLLKTESSDTVKDFAAGTLRKRALEGTRQTVLLLSGDGGVVDLVNGLLQDSVPKKRYVLSFQGDSYASLIYDRTRVFNFAHLKMEGIM
jgi:hypothetical protein